MLWIRFVFWEFTGLKIWLIILLSFIFLTYHQLTQNVMFRTVSEWYFLMLRWCTFLKINWKSLTWRFLWILLIVVIFTFLQNFWSILWRINKWGVIKLFFNSRIFFSLIFFRWIIFIFDQIKFPFDLTITWIIILISMFISLCQRLGISYILL